MRLPNRLGIVAACAAGLLLAACSHVPAHRHHAQPPAPGTPSAAALKLQDDYGLSRYNGQPLPAGVSHQGQCVTRVTSATLRLHQGRFKLDESLARYCQGELRSRTLKRAQGTVQLHNGHITLEASNRALFVRASGRLRPHAVVLTEVQKNGHTRKVNWRFSERSTAAGSSVSQSGA